MKKYKHSLLKPVCIVLLIISCLLVLYFGWQITAGLLGLSGHVYKTRYLLGLLAFAYALYCSILCLSNRMPEAVKELYNKKSIKKR